MNDRFKFRAWNKETKTMHYKAEQTYDCMTGTPLICKSSFGDVLDDENYIVEQCTGLKDKNGKLIYEGDRVNVCYSCFDGNGFSEYIYSGTVVWDEYSLVIQEDGDSIEDSSLFTNFNFFDKQTEEIEVIGNIHENPELLK